MPHKWKNLALIVLTLLIACQIGVSAVVRTRRVHRYLIAHLERAFGRPVEVTHFDVRILPRPRLDAIGVTVGEDPAFGYEYFLRAEQLSASLRWTGLLRGHFEFGTLSLSRPSLILVRNGEGRWNLERWLPPAAGSVAAAARVYGPPSPAAPVNRLQKIDIDEGRVNFKNDADKIPFAFTNVSGSVEQVSPGRWQLQLEAQPWRSGVALQSTGTVQVRGDLAGTSARLQPAEFRVHWDQVSLADLFRLLRGEDYGVRGVFAVDAEAKSGPSLGNGSSSAGSTAPQGTPSGEWTFSLQARAAQIHRWDLTERQDNPRVNVKCKGQWNPTAGTVNAEEMNIEAPKSNLRGTVNLSSGATPGMDLRVDSAGIQAADLLAWYRAFHPYVAEGVEADQYFTGALKLHGWPLELKDAAFSSQGGEIKLPEQPEPIRIGAIEGGSEGARLVVEPVRVSFPGKSGAAAPPAKGATLASKRSAGTEIQNGAEIAFNHDFETHEGAVSINGRVEKIEDLLKLTAALGRQINHGWELAGAANAALRWEWRERPLHGFWSGRVAFTKAQLAAAGLNQPLKFEDAAMEWQGGKRIARIGKVSGFGANWTGEIAEASAADADKGSAKWKFQLHADHLNAAELDRWVGPRARPNWLQRLLASLLGGASQNLAASELLRRINAEGELRADEITVESLKLGDVHAVAAVHDLKLEVSDATAQWAGGRLRAKIRAAFSPLPMYEFTGEIDGVTFAQLPSSARVAQRFGGVASGTVHLTTAGVGREELLQKLAGKGDVHLKNIEFRGWDVNASVADGAPRTGASRWTTGEGTFTLRDRSIAVNALRLESGKEEAVVNGTVSFARDADLTIETASTGKRVATVTDVPHVLKITGPLDGPRVSVANPAVRQPAD
ncbi:MAG TPA: AsmA family protein [Candidatus Methylomirabilis sp.]|nr:AsmA family protein [Candidatus Methylomirabilis sp.]